MHLGEIAHKLIELEVDQYQLAFVHPVGSAAKDYNFFQIVPRFEMLRPHLWEGLEAGIEAGISTMTEAVPYCFMQGYEEYVGEKIMPKTRVVDAEGVIESYQSYRLTQGKAKGPACKSCKMNDLCEGPWREYPENYGWGEFVAVM